MNTNDNTSPKRCLTNDPLGINFTASPAKEKYIATVNSHHLAMTRLQSKSLLKLAPQHSQICFKVLASIPSFSQPFFD